jgi:type IV pilus assembly protein PilC
MEFEYKAVDNLGKVISGKSEADNRIEVITSLQNQGLTLLDLADSRENNHEKLTMGNINISFEGGISEKTLIFFTRQFASTLKAGIPILRCLNLLESQSTSLKMKKVLEDVSADLQRGKSLHEAMASHNPPFNNLYLSMVKVGETTGDLARVMENLAGTLEVQYGIKRKIKSALSYPIFILVFSLVMVYLMMTHLMPGFMPIFKDSGLDIRHQYPITQLMLDASAELSTKWFFPVFIIVIILVYLIMKLIRSNEKGRFITDKAWFNFPILRGFVQMQYFSRMANSMGSLLSSGIQIQESLGLTADSADNLLVKQALHNTLDNLEQGNSLSSSLASVEIFPPMVIQMVSIGEESGNLDDMFFRLSEYYKQELEGALASLTSLIEPVMMVGVGVVVLVFVLGIFMPIMGISQSYQQTINR